MPDSLVDGLLGPDEAAGEAGAETRMGAEAYAAAVAADLGKRDPGVARATRLFLARQARLLKSQDEQLNEERPLRLASLHSRSRDDRLRRVGLVLRVGLQLFAALVAAVAVGGIVAMIADAFNSRTVIVDPFDAPPALAARGLSGKVVASRLLDELTRLQASTRTSQASRRLSGAWSGDIKVEVPETGVSIGDIDRMLKARLGHDLHIGGDLVQTETGGLALTVRGDGVLPKAFTGAASDLDRLTAEAAEYIYGQSQPAIFDGYLMNSGRNAEAIAFAKAAFASANPEDRPYLLNAWADALGNLGGSPRASLALYEEALRLKPDFWLAYNNVMNADWDLGDEEAAWRAGEQLRKAAGGRPGRAPETFYQNADILSWNLQAMRNALLADEAAKGGIGTGTTADGPQIADIDVRLHDAADAMFQLQTVQSEASDPSPAAIAHYIRGRIALVAGDAQTAAREMEAFGAAAANPEVATNYPGYTCWIAPAEEAAGHPDRADAVLAAGGHFVDCYRFRADILDHRGDWAAAQQAYAAAVAVAPDLPAAYYSWGLALARHGDLAGAVAKLAAANARGPHWADPLKAWGDVLGREDRWGEARVRYAEALTYAPGWPDLHAAIAAAARRPG